MQWCKFFCQGSTGRHIQLLVRCSFVTHRSTHKKLWPTEKRKALHGPLLQTLSLRQQVPGTRRRPGSASREHKSCSGLVHSEREIRTNLHCEDVQGCRRRFLGSRRLQVRAKPQSFGLFRLNNSSGTLRRDPARSHSPRCPSLSGPAYAA